jgi:hypothetical protein
MEFDVSMPITIRVSAVGYRDIGEATRAPREPRAGKYRGFLNGVAARDTGCRQSGHEQGQVGSFFFVTACHIIAAAQPTPLSTVTASKGQLSWQAPHSMHAAGLVSITSPLLWAKT